MKYQVIIVVSFLTVLAVTAEDCGPCDRSRCPKIGICPGGTALDKCSCCEQCSRRLAELCDRPNEPIKYGTCGDLLACRPRTDVRVRIVRENTCQCTEKEDVCGSDGKDYESVCELLEATVLNPKLAVRDRTPCKKAPVINSSPEDGARPIGGILILDCEASGYPVPEITWELVRSDGSSTKLPSDDSTVAVQVRGGPEKHMVTGWVQIIDIRKDTIGTYVCIATNSKGQDRKAATINIADKRNSGYGFNRL